MATKSLEALEKRIKALEERQRITEDIEEIKKLQIRYVNCVTFAKYDEIMDCFYEHSITDIQGKVTKGLAEIEKLFKEGIAKNHYGVEGMLLLHPIISVNGDKAKGSWLLYEMFSHHRTWQSLFWAQGVYYCEYARVNGQWKFSLLKWNCRLGLGALLERQKREVGTLHESLAISDQVNFLSPPLAMIQSPVEIPKIAYTAESPD